MNFMTFYLPVGAILDGMIHLGGGKFAAAAMEGEYGLKGPLGFVDCVDFGQKSAPNYLIKPEPILRELRGRNPHVLFISHGVVVDGKGNAVKEGDWRDGVLGFPANFALRWA